MLFLLNCKQKYLYNIIKPVKVNTYLSYIINLILEYFKGIPVNSDQVNSDHFKNKIGTTFE